MSVKYQIVATLFTALIYQGKCQGKSNYPNADSQQVSNAAVSSLAADALQYCKTKENTKGICSRVSQCEAVLEKNLAKYKPNVCYWIDLEPIVCCDRIASITEQSAQLGSNSVQPAGQTSNSQWYNSQPYDSRPYKSEPVQSYSTPHKVYQQKQVDLFVTPSSFRPSSARPPSYASDSPGSLSGGDPMSKKIYDPPGRTTSPTYERNNRQPNPKVGPHESQHDGQYPGNRRPACNRASDRNNPYNTPNDDQPSSEGSYNKHGLHNDQSGHNNQNNQNSNNNQNSYNQNNPNSQTSSPDHQPAGNQNARSVSNGNDRADPDYAGSSGRRRNGSASSPDQNLPRNQNSLDRRQDDEEDAVWTSGTRSKLPACGKRINLNNLPAIRIVKGNETKKSEFPFTVAIYVTPDYYSTNREKERTSTAATPARNSKRKNSSRSSKNLNSSDSSSSSSTGNSSDKSNSSGSYRKPKFSARGAIKRIVQDHLFGAFAALSLSQRHRRSKRFLTYPSQRTGYYRTRPMRLPESSIDLPQSSYRTVPLRSNGDHLNSNYLNNRMNAYFSAPIISPLRQPIGSPSISSIGSPVASSSPLSSPSPVRSMNSPIVNINPSMNHPKAPNNYAFTTENSNARKPDAEHSTDSSLSSLDSDENLEENLKQECAGSVLTDRFILSAAHCFENKDVSVYRVGVGSHQLKNLRMYSVRRLHMHPKYSKKQFYNDIAIIELNDTLAFNENVQPICIPDRQLLKSFNLDESYVGRPEEVTFEERTGLRSSSRAGGRSSTLVVDSERILNKIEENTAVVVGWGTLLYSGAVGSEKLRKAYLRLVKQADCDRLFRKLHSATIPQGITSSMLCASGSDPNTVDELSDDDQENSSPDACQNDSGGPLYARLVGSRSDLNRLPANYSSIVNFGSEENDVWQYNWVQLGIVSFGYRCGTKFPGVYTNVVHYAEWIRSVVY